MRRREVIAGLAVGACEANPWRFPSQDARFVRRSAPSRPLSGPLNVNCIEASRPPPAGWI
jgi:hypothetical protein